MTYAHVEGNLKNMLLVNNSKGDYLDYFNIYIHVETYTRHKNCTLIHFIGIIETTFYSQGLILIMNFTIALSHLHSIYLDLFITIFNTISSLSKQITP